MSDQIRASGFRFGESRRNGNKKQITAKFRLEVDESARVSFEGVGNDRSAGVQSRSSHVTKFLRDWDDAERAVSDPPIVPYTKAMQIGSKKPSKRDQNGLVPCPACDGAGWDDCCLCEGGGLVSARAARAYNAN